MNEKKIEGSFDQAKGDVKENVGEATGDVGMQAEGVFDKMKGGLKKAVGQAQEDVNNNT